MHLGVKVCQKCETLLNSKMRDLSCQPLQLDEIWGFVGKKQRRVREVEESNKIGDAWTFCALDAETKLVPCFRVGKRDAATANAFLLDLSSRMKNRVQVSTDGLRAYIEAVEQGFGADVDYAQIVKSYESDDGSQPERRYNPPRVVSIEKRNIVGNSDAKHISTSYIERQNLTMRTHMRRLTRLTLGFSKKLENFEAAVALHFAYYNLCKIHKTLRCTPAMASGVEKSIWTVGDLVEATN